MILVDSGVWINFFNGQRDKYTAALDAALVDSTAAIGDLILLEVLQGFRSDKEYKRAQRALNQLDQYELLGHGMVLKCAENYRSLRKRGITIRRTNDVIIATFCIEYDMPLLFADRDFKPFVEHLGLKPAFKET